ncbi:aminotransferase class I/II-fold pyridoxal phosphate-dependent enzyme [Streptomyces rubellomurinus]|uniref:aminotransferase class I/II-fold pyridoxal phosphate-dependent enzyme n=1 Tax=Streptomyces rubellomurinus (strain ATCC 31215) TaxID=359131 RepID=UPI0006966153|nr:aminotransferase class I/II-fold pyridoxal phosphate-dependent enzyme [Streptomyces rubellomurinus]
MTQASLFRMLDLHEEIERERQRPGGRLFVSDYNGGHPFVADYLGPLADTPPHRLTDVTRYAALGEDHALRAKIARLHSRWDGVAIGPEQVIPAAGSSGLLGTFCTWLRLTGVRRVHYLPPVYYKFAYFFRQFGIEPVPVSPLHAHQPGFTAELPDERSVLLLTDPLWYTGRPVPAGLLARIAEWQLATGSTVFVDGTFQYLRWDGGRREESAALPADLTLRLVCPTKSLSIHGYRCAHLITPCALREPLAELHLNLHGDATAADRLFAHRAADLMLDGEGNRRLIEHVRANHRRLLAGGALLADSPVDTGYFLFARPAAPADRLLALDQRHFELTGHEGFVRINLLNEPALEGLRTLGALGTIGTDTRGALSAG